MHELAITESIVAGVLERTGSARVTRVVVEIGRLSGVVPDAVRFCFDLCATGTALEGAALDVMETPGRALCRQCGAEQAIDDLFALCACGSADLEILAGQALKVKAAEVI